MFTFKRKHPEIKTVLDKWMFDNFYDKNCYVITAFEVCGRNLYIYTNKPGILIGYHGKCADDLRNKLKSAGIRKNIHFIDLGDSSLPTHEIRVKRKWL